MDADGKPRSRMEIGADIATWCHEKKVTREMLAEKLECSSKSISRLWHGEGELTSHEIGILSDYMKKDSDFFIERDGKIRDGTGSCSGLPAQQKPGDNPADEGRLLQQQEEMEVNKELYDKFNTAVRSLDVEGKKNLLLIMNGLLGLHAGGKK